MTARALRVLKTEGEKARIRAFDFDPAGALIAGGSDDGTVHIWHVGDGTVRAVYHGGGSAIENVLFSGDGQRLFATSNGALLEWEVLPAMRLSSSELLAYGRSVLQVPPGSGGKSAYAILLKDGPNETPLVPIDCPLDHPHSIGLPPHRIKGAVRARQALRIPEDCRAEAADTDPYVRGRIAEIEGDYEVAQTQYNKALAAKNYSSLIGIADLLYLGGSADVESFRNKYIEAKNRNVPLAAARLGWLSTLGIFSDSDRVAAKNYFLESASRREADGYAGLGWMEEQIEVTTPEGLRRAFVDYAAAEVLYLSQKDFMQASVMAERPATIAGNLPPNEIPLLLNKAAALASTFVPESLELKAQNRQ